MLVSTFYGLSNLFPTSWTEISKSSTTTSAADLRGSVPSKKKTVRSPSKNAVAAVNDDHLLNPLDPSHMSEFRRFVSFPCLFCLWGFKFVCICYYLVQVKAN